jgi:hypothetical protein
MWCLTTVPGQLGEKAHQELEPLIELKLKRQVLHARPLFVSAVKLLSIGQTEESATPIPTAMIRIHLKVRSKSMKDGKAQKTVTIIVEGTPHEWPKKQEITYAELVTLEVPDYAQHPEITYSVKFTKGNGNKPAGVLAPGGSLKVKEGMIFNVSETGQS